MKVTFKFKSVTATIVLPATVTNAVQVREWFAANKPRAIIIEMEKLND
jgi:hypothetical protein